MNWNNIDLKSDYERNQNIVDGYSFDTLLLEVYCNIKGSETNEATIRRQFETELISRVETARDIFEANLANIVKEARGT